MRDCLLCNREALEFKPQAHLPLQKKYKMENCKILHFFPRIENFGEKKVFVKRTEDLKMKHKRK
jgi:hypothetical protein